MRRVIGFLVLGGAVTVLLVRRLITARRPPRKEVPQANLAAALVYQRGREVIERAQADLRASADRLPFRRSF